MDTRNNTPVTEVNRAFYDPLWSGTDLIGPERFSTWPVVRRHAGETSHRLEVGPGLRPRWPSSGTHLADIIPAALARMMEALARRGPARPGRRGHRLQPGALVGRPHRSLPPPSTSTHGRRGHLCRRL
jgi:hypothetical protein